MIKWRLGLLNKQSVRFQRPVYIPIELPAEQAHSGADRIRTVYDDHIIVVFGFFHPGNPVANLHFQFGMILQNRGADLRQELFTGLDHHAIDLNHFHLFDRVMANNFTHSPAVPTANHKNFPRFGMRKQRNMHNHLVINIFLKN